MTGLFWLSYVTRSFLRSGRRAVFAVICVTVGVAGVVALETAGLTVEHALTSNVRAANGGDISMTSDEVPLSGADLQLFRRLQRQGRISAWTAVASAHVSAVGAGGRLVPFTVNLVSLPVYPLGGQPAFISPSDGTVSGLLRRPGDVLLTTVLAQELGVGRGSRLLVQGIGRPAVHATVQGVLGEASLDHSATMTADARFASSFTAAPPRYTALYLSLHGSPASVAALLRARFPTATVQTVAEALQVANGEVHDFQQFLRLVGLLALLVAGVGILNAMQSILARRRLEIAMLKATGFREPVLYRLFGGEALLIGLSGGLLGTALGASASKIIAEALAQAAAIKITFTFDTGTILGGVALGVGATMIFAAVPIVRAASLRPLEVLREGTPPPPSQWLRASLVLALVFCLFTLLTALTVGDPLLAAQFVLGVTLACLALACLFALFVAWISWLGPAGSRLGGALIVLAALLLTALAAVRLPAVAPILALGALLLGLSVVLPRHAVLPLLIGARSLRRRPVRTALMLVAFLAGVLAMTVTLTVASTLQGQVSALLARHRSQNLVAIAAGGSGQIMRASLSLSGIHGRQVMTTITTEPVQVNGRSPASYVGPNAGGPDDARDEGIWALNGLTGYALAQGSLPQNVQVVEGRGLTAADAGSNHVLLRDDLTGYPYFLQPGQTMLLRETGSGNVGKVQVVGFYQRARREEDFGSFSTPPILGDARLAGRLGGADAQTVVTFAVNQRMLAHDAATLQRLLPGVLVVDVGDLTAIVDTILNELLHLLTVITVLVLAAGIAVVANGVALAMLERRREIALYKAIGFGTGSVQSFVLIENALIGTLAGAMSVAVTAIALGLLSRFAFQRSVALDPTLSVLVLLLATAMAVATAYLSARGPIRIRPLEALRNE